jgi:drug/metabolite transporter (DMT)-like permease
MIVLLLAGGASLAGALGLYLTKSISLRMPVWQAVAPLFLINALLVVPLIPFGGPWIFWEPHVLALHAISVALLVGTTACIFGLITRGRPSAVAVGQALSPASVLIAAPLILGESLSIIIVVGVVLLMMGSLLPLRRSFEGLRSSSTILILIVLGAGTGLLTVVTGALVDLGVGLPETYIVRAAGASLVYFIVAPPRALSLSDIPPLAVRSSFVTLSFLLTILAVQRGSVITIQSVLATMPLLVLLIEWIRRRQTPEPGVLIGAMVVAIGLALLLRVDS